MGGSLGIILLCGNSTRRTRGVAEYMGCILKGKQLYLRLEVI